ncbi:MAG: bifunctional UDP-N-acetylglucosamine diphosphorylase/glucosamine-1-phosphate N-acetyltransferase GlmU [Gammaproteobacteria bacterium]|nr:bifunctional UDP-N-acetylglucosamine diphosphorylase/glucosamine-1-phosphate N-acetyltransferase GlmU [Gammaproteobacteria bacterium]
MHLEVIVLAAGQGTRMKSRIPKVLHTVAGQPMLTRVFETVRALKPERTHVVISENGDRFQSIFSELDVNWVHQSEQLGTGHAVLQALPDLDSEAQALVVYGDCPLVKPSTLKRCAVEGQDGVGLISAVVPEPYGLGRIIRNPSGNVEAIIEQTDISPEQCEIKEINSGILSAPVGFLREHLPRLTDNNAQGEIYLTDLVAEAVSNGVQVNAIQAIDYQEVLGVNDRLQLAQVERVFQQRQAENLMKQGVSIADPSRFDCRGTVKTGIDCTMDINVILEGDIELGDNVRIGSNCILRNVQIASDTIIKENTVIEEAKIGRACSIGPFARIRPGTTLDDKVGIGNFVEVKNSQLASGVKAAHLAYLGDAEIGTDTNIGAGAITCNYDGKNKHRTTIGDNVFIGSNTSLIAPITIESGSAVAAGSSITRNVNADELVIERADQRIVKGGGTRFRRR